MKPIWKGSHRSLLEEHLLSVTRRNGDKELDISGENMEPGEESRGWLTVDSAAIENRDITWDLSSIRGFEKCGSA